MTLTELVDEAHALAVSKGWWVRETRGGIPGTVFVDPREVEGNLPEKLCLIHSEVSEALESFRRSEPLSFTAENGKPEGVAAELADVVIRVADLCGALHIDLESEVLRKHAFNKTRSVRHGGKRA